MPEDPFGVDRLLMVLTVVPRIENVIPSARGNRGLTARAEREGRGRSRPSVVFLRYPCVAARRRRSRSLS